MPRPRRKCPAALLTALFLALVSAASASTEPVPDPDWINPSSDPEFFTTAGPYVYFTADDGIHGRELWRTDGTAEGTILLADIVPGARDSNPTGLHAVGEQLYFMVWAAGTKTHVDLETSAGLSIWRTAGTPESTGPVLDGDGNWLRPHSYLTPRGIAAFQGSAWFAVLEQYPAHGVWRAEAGDFEARPIGALPARSTNTELVACHNVLYYHGRAPQGPTIQAVHADGTEHTVLELDNPNSVLMKCAGDNFFFVAQTPETGIELWRSRGTPETTALVKDIVPGPEGITDLVHFFFDALDDRIIFRAYHPDYGNEPWVSDGTEAGTHLLRDIHPGPESSLPGYFTRAGDLIFFQAEDPAHGTELWATDGTSEGTRLVKDIYPGRGSSNPFALHGHGDILYFTAEEPRHGGELWRSDGTREGTYLVRDIQPGGASWPRHKASLGDDLIFVANDGIHGREPWITDGTAEGTRMLKDIWPVRGPNPSSNPQQLISVGDLLFFVVNDAAHGAELWRSDGTHDGTFLVKDIFPGPASSSPAEFCAFGDLLYFQADNGVHGIELWVSDGTEEGTRMVHDLNPGAASSSPHQITRLGDHIAFAADNGANGFELFRYTPGSGGPPALVTDIHPGPEGSNPTRLTVHGDRLYFVADDGTHGAELWTSDLTPEGTHLVRDILPRPSTLLPPQESGAPVSPSTIHYPLATLAPHHDHLYLLGHTPDHTPTLTRHTPPG